MRVLCSECGSECVDVGEGTAEILNTQLTRDCQERRFSKEIFLVVDSSFFKRYLLLLLLYLSLIGLLFNFLCCCLSSSRGGGSLFLCSLSCSLFCFLFLYFLRFLSIFLLLNLFNRLVMCAHSWYLFNWVFGFWQNSGHLEHLAGSLTIRGCDDGSVNVLETAGLEELMGSIGQVVADTGHSTYQVSSWSQMSFVSQEFVRVALFR